MEIVESKNETIIYIVGEYKNLNTYEKRNIYEKNEFLSMNVLCIFTDIKRRNFNDKRLCRNGSVYIENIIKEG